MPIVSTLTGGEPDESMGSAAYWVGQVRGAVRFADAVTAMYASDARTFLEIGPGGVLSGMATETLESIPEAASTTIVASLHGADEPLALTTALARLHVHGTAIDWKTYFDNVHGTGLEHVDLPTYAFQHEQYWLANAKVPADQTFDPMEARFWDAVEQDDLAALRTMLAESGTALDPEAPFGEVLTSLSSWHTHNRRLRETGSARHHLAWRPYVPAAIRGTGDWLLLATQNPESLGLAERCATGLRDAGAEAIVIGVAPGASLDTLVTEGFSGLAKQPTHVVSMLCIDQPGEELGEIQLPGIAETTALLDALNRLGFEGRMWNLTCEAVAASPAERTPDRWQAACLWGFGAVTAIEQPRLWGGMIDVPRRQDERVIELLCRTLMSADGEDQITIRAGGGLVRRLVPASDGAARKAWRPRGTVLIAGDAGPHSTHVAGWLARNGADHLLVVSASDGVETERRLSEVQAELVGTTARLSGVACDLTDRAAVEKLIDSIGAQAPLTAVIFGSDPGAPKPDSALDAREFAAEVRAQTLAAWHLHELTGHLAMDAFVLSSSMAGVVGGSGQAVEAAVGACLQAISALRVERGLAASCIAWGALGAVGQGSHPELAGHGMTPIDPDRATVLMQTAVEHGAPLEVIADVDWTTFAASYTAQRPGRLIAELVPEQLAGEDAADTGATADRLRSELADAAEPARLRMLRDLVRTEAAITLGHTEARAIEADRSFTEVGFDSLMAVRLRDRLSRATGLTVPSTLVFDYPTPVAVAGFLLEEFAIGAESGRQLMAELDRLEIGIDALADDGGIDVAAVGTRLRALLSKVQERTAARFTEEIATDVDAANADEMFDILRNEFGGPDSLFEH